MASSKYESVSSTFVLKSFLGQPPFPDRDAQNRELSLGFPSIITRVEAKLGEKLKLKIQVCDLVDGLTIEGTVDGVHPKLAVHLEIGKKLANFISSNLDKED